MDDKHHVELHIFQSFWERTTGKTVGVDELLLGDPDRNEPDILYDGKGFEIGAVLSRTNTRIDSYERDFTNRASEAIRGKIPDSYQIRLVLQDDRDTVEHRPTDQFKDYKYLPQFLDGIFVEQYRDAIVIDKVVLNQKSRMRVDTFPRVRSKKEFIGFVDELSDYVNSLKASDFGESAAGEDAKSHHGVVTHGRVVRNLPNPLNDFVSPKILDKLREDKYSGPYNMQILLLHNYSTIGNSQFSSDIHFYTHFRNDIFNFIADRITEHHSFDLYDGIYFLDYSIFACNTNFELIDFKQYTLRQPSKYLVGYDEIRAELRPVRIQPRKSLTK